VITTGVIAIGLAATAAIFGAIFRTGDSAPGWVNTYLAPARVILSVLGMVLAGCAVSMRPRWAGSWALGAAGCLLAGFGLPASWYSFRLVAFAFTGVGVVGAIVAVTPPAWRIIPASAAVLFHFSGIWSAVTQPYPSPELTQQLWVAVFRPYLQFAYLNNAYQFYSPDPGPASELWFCIEYEPKAGDAVETDGDGNPKLDDEGQPTYKKTVKWIKIPRRPRDFKDPLGQAYYRRLSLTENVSNPTTPHTQMPPKVMTELQQRRNVRSDIPLFENDIPLYMQCRIPSDFIQGILMPSFVRHVAEDNQRGDRKISGIKVYRVLHKIVLTKDSVGAQEGYNFRYFTRPFDPYEPTMYLPYYYGEYNTAGEMKVLNDPMLYWAVPIVRNSGISTTEFEKHGLVTKLSDYHRLYTDYVSIHAGSDHKEGELEK
jgi:hypothetical protein